MFRNMVTSLIEEERIQTTAAKAKEVRPLIERLITLGKRNAPSVVAQAGSDSEKQRLTAARVAAVRQAGKTVRNRFALQKLFGDLAERFVDRPGGYTRVLRVGRRLGDNAELAIIELLPEGYEKAGRTAPSEPLSFDASTDAAIGDALRAAAAEGVAAEDAPAAEAAAEEPAAEAAAEEPAAEAAAEEPAAEAATEDAPAAEDASAAEAAAEDAPAAEAAAEEAPAEAEAEKEEKTDD